MLLHNVTAGRRETPGRVAAVAQVLESGGFRVETCGVDTAAGATASARQGAARSVDAVFAMGGDGTVRDAAAGLYGTPVALGVLPAGTTNVVARALGLPLDPVSAARALAGAGAHPIDVGLCGERPFLMQASAGFDASLMARVDRRLKERFGRLSIALQGVALWWRYGYPELALRVDGRPVRARQVIACNIPEYGGSHRIVAGARFDDARLDVLLFRGRGRRATLGFYLDFARGVHERRADVEVLSAETVELLGPPELDLQIDGDALPGALPALVRLAPERLRVLLPAA